ncbi:MAG: spore coat U domain-containing protein [Oceanococcaceae bacterium]
MKTMLMNLTSKYVIAAAALVASVLSLPAAAQSFDSGDMLVTATVDETCVITVPPLAFGNYSGSQLDGTADVLVQCTSGTAWAVAIDGGVTNGDIADRQMASGGDRLSYDLFNDAGRTTLFGDGTTGSTATGTGNGNEQTVTVYGRIDADQFPPAGSYQDTVTVTVTAP